MTGVKTSARRRRPKRLSFEFPAILDESSFGLRPETGNVLTDHCSEKPQCFTDFGQVVVFSADSRRAGVNVDRAWIQALQLSAVSGKDATG